MKAKILKGLSLIPLIVVGALIWPLFVPIVVIACIGKVVSASKYDV